jgi:transposase
MEVTLTVAQVQRHDIIRGAIDRRITNTEAAAALRLSIRQVQRLKRRVEASGPVGVLHGNQGRDPPNKTPEEVRSKAIDLAMGEYADYNYCHLAETLSRDHGIHLSDETLRVWLRPLGHGPPKRRAKKHRRRRKRKERAGEMLFLDGSPHHWFGEDHRRVCLLLASDDATGDPLRGKFVPAENRDGCFEVCYHVFRKHGLPAGFYIDQASQFKTTRKGGQHVPQRIEQDDTHFQRAMKELRIGITFAKSPQARGRAERLNGSFQGRLVAELKHAGITDCDAATKYVNDTFIPRYVKSFSRQPADPQPAWRPVPRGLNLKQVLCAKDTRTVANDNTIQFKGDRYQLTPPSSCYHLFRAKVEVQQWFDGCIHVWYPEHGMIRSELIPSEHAKPEAAQ